MLLMMMMMMRVRWRGVIAWLCGWTVGRTIR